jgi:Zn-finger protein
MSQYAIKTCYDCGIKKPANEMERVTESYNSGQSNTTATAGNLAWAAMGDKRGQNAVGRAFKANNRRKYTRNRNVWKCLDCSGHNQKVAERKAYAKLRKEGKVMNDNLLFGGIILSGLWFLAFLFLWVVAEIVLKFDINDIFMWISAVGSISSFMYFTNKHQENEKAIKDEISY